MKPVEALTGALHLISHEHGDLWHPQPGCGCEDKAVAIILRLPEGWKLTGPEPVESEPEGELLCDTCGRRFADGSDPCDDCREDCPHEHVIKDDDGRDRWFYVCDDCDQVVELSEPDEDGKSIWEVVE